MAELPLPRLGDFSEVFRVLTDSPRRPQETTSSPAASPLPLRLRETKTDKTGETTQRSASRRAVFSPAPAVGFLAGIERYFSPAPDDDGGASASASASETDDPSDPSDPSDSSDSDHVSSFRALSPAVVVVSASTSPATAAAAVATPVKRRSLIPKTTPRRVVRPSSSQPTPSTLCTPPPLIGNVIVPLRAESRAAKLARIEARLAKDRPPATTTPPQSPAVHVFVDLSNIAIGFITRLRTDRGVPPERRVQEPPLFFGGLARILERNRQVERRVTAGSLRTSPSTTTTTLLARGGPMSSDSDDDEEARRWHAYMVEAKALGYEMNLLRRLPGATGHGEQGVDEVLQLKMCNSVLDAAPGTLVLATGDGAAAEFSDGFLRNVQRALDHGWCVELVAWRQGIATVWRTLARERRERFRIVELDGFVHELHGVFASG